MGYVNLKSMQSHKRIVFFQLTFVFMISSGFTCQKKYPEPDPETESSQSEDSAPATSSDSSIENSNSPSETTTPSEGNSQKPVDKTDQ